MSNDIYYHVMEVTFNYVDNHTLFYSEDVQLKVDSATATEGESVTLTCSTSCTLSGNPTFTWNKNGRQINTQQTGTGNRLRLNPVSSEDAGSYSCAIRGHADLPSTAVTVSVRCKQVNVSVQNRKFVVDVQSKNLL